MFYEKFKEHLYSLFIIGVQLSVEHFTCFLRFLLKPLKQRSTRLPKMLNSALEERYTAGRGKSICYMNIMTIFHSLQPVHIIY